MRSGNLTADAPKSAPEELITILADHPGVRIERIVSTGQASPTGFWYDQDAIEWVFLISGSAALSIEGESAARILRPGDWLEIPAHVRHRVEETDSEKPTIWLAIHIKAV